MPVILFICTANIIRSPIAAALLSQKLSKEGVSEDWQVASAGTWARNGYPAARLSQELLYEMGLDLSGHRSRIVNEEMLRSANLILVMETGHKEALCHEFSGISSRVFLLSEMIGEVANVEDPVGGNREDFQGTIRNIKELIDQGFSRILDLSLKA